MKGEKEMLGREINEVRWIGSDDSDAGACEFSATPLVLLADTAKQPENSFHDHSGGKTHSGNKTDNLTVTLL